MRFTLIRSISFTDWTCCETKVYFHPNSATCSLLLSTSFDKISKIYWLKQDPYSIVCLKSDLTKAAISGGVGSLQEKCYWLIFDDLGSRLELRTTQRQRTRESWSEMFGQQTLIDVSKPFACRFNFCQNYNYTGLSSRHSVVQLLFICNHLTFLQKRDIDHECKVEPSLLGESFNEWDIRKEKNDRIWEIFFYHQSVP